MTRYQLEVVGNCSTAFSKEVEHKCLPNNQEKNAVNVQGLLEISCDYWSLSVI